MDNLGLLVVFSFVVFVVTLMLQAASLTDEQREMIQDDQITEARESFDSYQRSLTFLGATSLISFLGFTTVTVLFLVFDLLN